MKTMIFTDLITMKNSLLSLLGITTLLGLFFIFAMQTVIGAIAVMSTLVPFMYLISVSSYDEMGGWERFRLTLPITRRQVVFGRYGSLLLVALASALFALTFGHIVVTVGDLVPGAPAFITSAEVSFPDVGLVVLATTSIILIAASCTFPLVMRFGMTKAARFVPVIVVAILALGIALLGDSDIFGELGTMVVDSLVGSPTALPLILGACAGVLVLYCASSLLTARLYADREF